MKTVLTLIFIFSWVGYVHCAQDTKKLHAAVMAVAVKSPSISHRHKPKRTACMRQLQNQQQATAKRSAAGKLVAAQALQSTHETPAQNLAVLDQDSCGPQRAAASVTPISQQPTSIDEADQFAYISRLAKESQPRHVMPLSQEGENMIMVNCGPCRARNIRTGYYDWSAHIDHNCSY